MIRSFMAIELPEAFHAEIERLRVRLKSAGADVKWVRPAGVHLTLKFLGDVLEDTIGPLARAAAEAVAPHPPLTLSLNGLGVFPGPSQPRVVWVGLAGDLAALDALRLDLEAAAAKFGFAPEKRPFKPHLTLGRVRSNRGRAELIACLGRLEVEPLSFTAGEVIYFKSDLKPSGAEYTALHRLPLEGGKREEPS
ncbi:MAG: RNA 2',3'-cyclic phosphodiesterase [Thermodesulfobacteriota bacterium]